MIRLYYIILLFIFFQSCTTYSVFYDKLETYEEYLEDAKPTSTRPTRPAHFSNLVVIVPAFFKDKLYLATDRQVYQSGHVICDPELEVEEPLICKDFIIENFKSHLTIKINNKKFIVPKDAYLSYEYLIIQYDNFNKNRYDIAFSNKRVMGGVAKLRPELGNNAKKNLLPPSKQLDLNNSKRKYDRHGRPIKN